MKQNLVLPRWIHWLTKTRTFWAKCDALSRGTSGKNRIKPELFLTIEIPLPSIEEQRRIVARIEELAAKVEEARGLRREADEETDSLLESGSQFLLNHLDGDERRPLSELVTIRSGGTPSRSNPFFWNGKIPWISPKDMKVRAISDSTEHISEAAVQNSATKLLSPGSVLVVVRGMILVHAVPAAVLRAPAAINQDIKALLPNGRILPEYLCNVPRALNRELLGFVEKSTHDTRRLETDKLLSRNFSALAISATIAELGAELRAQYRLRTPDALQIAPALEAGCEAFLSNDAGLRRVTELRVLILDDLEL